MALHGGCACGAVRYVVSRDKLPGVVCCHCRDCQTRSGSAFDQTAFVGPAELEVTGPIVTFNSRGASGFELQHTICGSCHTMIFNVHEASPGNALLRAGTFDDSELLVPIAHIFTKRKQAWMALPDGVPAYEDFPPQAEFHQLLNAASQRDSER